MFQTAVPKKEKLSFVPPPVSSVEETGLSFLWLEDHILKLMYFQGYLTGYKIAEEIALPFAGIVDPCLRYRFCGQKIVDPGLYSICPEIQNQF